VGRLSTKERSMSVKIVGSDFSGNPTTFVGSDTEGNMFVRLNGIPVSSITPIDAFLKNGSSKAMNVNGSSTPVNFDFAPGQGEVWYLSKISSMLSDDGLTRHGPGDFGGLSSLTNGVEIRIKTEGAESVLATLQDNADFLQVFSDLNRDYSEVFSSQIALSGTRSFINPIKLDGDQGDFIRFRILDNLTGLTHFRATAKLFKSN